MLLDPRRRAGLFPLPVVFVSTVSRDGVRNVAPYGCFMPILRPLDLVCLASAKERDTLRNIRETGEFVVNLAGPDFVDKVMPTAKPCPPDSDEFVLASLSEKPSLAVRPPGIAGCYAWMECALYEEYSDAQFSLVVGQVLRLEAEDSLRDKDGRLDIGEASPLMMVAGDKGIEYYTVRDLVPPKRGEEAAEAEGMARADTIEAEFSRCAAFHGHICPGLALGFVAATEGMRRLKQHRSEDEEIVAVVETDSCAVDAVQVVTGCTFGKGNLVHKDNGKTAFTFLVRSTGRGLRLSMRPDALSMDESHWTLLKKVMRGEATQEERSLFGEAHARRAHEILGKSPEALFAIEEVAATPPERARIEPSEACQRCGEPTMRTKLIPCGELKLCRDCSEKQISSRPG